MTTDAVARILAEIAVVVLIPLLIWNAKVMIGFKEGITTLSSDIKKLSLVIFGEEELEGLVKKVNKLSDHKHEINNKINNHEFRLHEIERHLGGNDDRAA